MRVLKRILLVAGASVAAASLAGAASAAVIITSFTGGPFSGLNPLGSLPTTTLKAGNTYDFTFDLVAPIAGPSATQAEADTIKISGSTPDLIQYQVYMGTPSVAHPEAGILLATSAIGFSPTVSGNWGVGDYYVNILSKEISKTGEDASGSFVTTPVPEPVTWGMMLLGVGMIGSGMRLGRRKHDTALSSI
jgi:hypothetical protein